MLKEQNQDLLGQVDLLQNASDEVLLLQSKVEELEEKTQNLHVYEKEIKDLNEIVDLKEGMVEQFIRDVDKIKKQNLKLEEINKKLKIQIDLYSEKDLEIEDL